MDFICKVQLEDLPEIALIEQRKHPKWIRKWSVDPFTTPSKSSPSKKSTKNSPSTLSKSSPSKKRTKNSPSSTSKLSPRKKATQNSPSSTSGAANESLFTDSPSPTKSTSGAANESLFTDSPSPTKSEGCSNFKSPRSARRRLNMESPSNYGSEDENSGEEEELPSIPVPKALRALIETALELEEEPVGQSVSPPSGPSTTSNSVDGTDLGEYKPTDLFDFQWQPFPKSPIPWNLRKETYIESNLGPRVHYAEPYDAFVAIWDRQIMEHICKQTNLYAQQLTNQMMNAGMLSPLSRITRWTDINVDELYVYFAIVIAMGMLIKSRLDEYWSGHNKDIFTTPGFSVYMSLNRFSLINRCLHFNNNQDLDISQLSRSQAKLWKLQPVLDHLNDKFSSLYCMGQNIALDESLTQWKGLSDTKQFMYNKAAGEGIKTFEICESQSGYLWRIEAHCGFEPSQNSGPVSGAIASTVLRLIRGLEFKGHTLWMDNYYNSPALARTLKSMQTDCVGTLRTNRRFVPAPLAKLTKADMARNELVGCTSGDVDVFVWRDIKCVGLISTYHGATTSRLGEVLKPTLVHDYNVCMGGVDKKDQMLALYPIERRRTKIWYKKFFRRLLNVSVLNSYIMYKFYTPTVTHRDFRLKLVRQLLELHHSDKELESSLKNRRPIEYINRASFKGPFKFSAEALNHFPFEFECITGKRSRLRRVCVLCKRRTQTHCRGCNVALCANLRRGASNEISCFLKHHS